MTKPLARRATEVYRTAEPEQLESGMDWYPSAHRLATRQALDHGVTIEVAAGVLSALSPRNPWPTNMRLAEEMLASGGTMTSGALGRSLAQARAIVAGGQPLEVLGGPKTRAFYHAILSAGESPDVVIDRHAWDMLVGQRGSPPPTLKQYREGHNQMVRGARAVGITPSQFQAVTWVTWRERRWSPDGKSWQLRFPYDLQVLDGTINAS